jgi:hypothetical protein
MTHDEVERNALFGVGDKVYLTGKGTLWTVTRRYWSGYTRRIIYDLEAVSAVTVGCAEDQLKRVP